MKDQVNMLIWAFPTGRGGRSDKGHCATRISGSNDKSTFAGEYLSCDICRKCTVGDVPRGNSMTLSIFVSLFDRAACDPIYRLCHLPLPMAAGKHCHLD